MTTNQSLLRNNRGSGQRDEQKVHPIDYIKGRAGNHDKSDKYQNADHARHCKAGDLSPLIRLACSSRSPRDEKEYQRNVLCNDERDANKVSERVHVITSIRTRMEPRA